MSDEDNEVMTVEDWRKRYRDPHPEPWTILSAIDECGLDRADERLAHLKAMVEGYYRASELGMFNDE